MFRTQNIDDFAVAVRITGVVDEPGGIPLHGGVHHHVVIHPEHVAADPLLVVILFPVVCQDGTYFLSSILDDLVKTWLIKIHFYNEKKNEVSTQLFI